MDITALLVAGAAFVVSIWLMVEGAEKLTESFLRISIAFGVSTFLLGYVLSGIDVENLAVGIAGAVGQAAIIFSTSLNSRVLCCISNHV